MRSNVHNQPTLVINRPKPLLLSAAIATFLGQPIVGYADNLTLHADSYVSNADLPTTKHGADTLMEIKSTNTAFVRFRLSDNLRSGITASDVEKVTLKLFLPTVTSGGT